MINKKKDNIFYYESTVFKSAHTVFKIIKI